MDQLLTTFGIDWRLLVINIFNFGLLLVGLRYFLYKPLTDMLEKRRTAVAQGVHDAAAAKEQLQEIESSRAAVLSKAGKEADETLARARAAAAVKERELIAAAEVAAAAIVGGAEAAGKEMKEQAIQESKQEVAKLIVLGMEKIMAKK